MARVRGTRFRAPIGDIRQFVGLRIGDHRKLLYAVYRARRSGLSEGGARRYYRDNGRRGRARCRTLELSIPCARGKMENRIKEQQLALFADRTSTQALRSNQLRLYLSSLPMCSSRPCERWDLGGRVGAGAMRHHSPETLEDRRPDRVTVRTVWIAFSGAGPSAANSLALLVTPVGLFSPLVPAT